MRGIGPQIAGARGKALLLRQRNDGMPVFLASEINAPQCTTFFMFARERIGRREAVRRLANRFEQPRFPNPPYSRSPKSAGREAALEVGLETCAAAVRRRDLTHNLSLSLVAFCHR